MPSRDLQETGRRNDMSMICITGIYDLLSHQYPSAQALVTESPLALCKSFSFPVVVHLDYLLQLQFCQWD